MNKQFREVLNGIGMVLCAFAMMAVGVGLIFLVTAIFHTNIR